MDTARGLRPAGDVDDAEVSLAWARAVPASAAGRPDAVKRHLRALAGVVREELKPAQAGTQCQNAPAWNVQVARRRLGLVQCLLAQAGGQTDEAVRQARSGGHGRKGRASPGRTPAAEGRDGGRD